MSNVKIGKDIVVVCDFCAETLADAGVGHCTGQGVHICFVCVDAIAEISARRTAERPPSAERYDA